MHRKGLVIRRFKKDVRHQVTGDFKERRTMQNRVWPAPLLVDWQVACRHPGQP
jgi:hypothetical protein